MGLKQAGGVPPQVLADLGRAAQVVAVTADGGLDEAGVQGSEALQVAAGAGVFDAADVFAGPGVQRARHVFDEQRREHDRRAGSQTQERDRDGEQAQRTGDAGGQADAPGGAPGQPAQRQALCARGRRGENSDLPGLGAVARDGPGEPAPPGALANERGFARGCARVVADTAGAQSACVYHPPPARVGGEGMAVLREAGRRWGAAGVGHERFPSGWSVRRRRTSCSGRRRRGGLAGLLVRGRCGTAASRGTPGRGLHQGRFRAGRSRRTRRGPDR